MKTDSDYRIAPTKAAPWRRSLYLRAALAIVLLPAITAYCAWIIQNAAQNAFSNTKSGWLIRTYERVAPQIEQHQQEIQELSSP